MKVIADFVDAVFTNPLSSVVSPVLRVSCAMSMLEAPSVAGRIGKSAVPPG